MLGIHERFPVSIKWQKLWLTWKRKLLSISHALLRKPCHTLTDAHSNTTNKTMIHKTWSLNERDCMYFSNFPNKEMHSSQHLRTFFYSYFLLLSPLPPSLSVSSISPFVSLPHLLPLPLVQSFNVWLISSVLWELLQCWNSWLCVLYGVLGQIRHRTRSWFCRSASRNRRGRDV